MPRQVNASLLHEIRMIAQTFLGHGQAAQYAMGIANARRSKAPKAAPTPVLKCCFCVAVRKPATSIIGGFSVCDHHEQLMRIEYKDYGAYASRMF